LNYLEARAFLKEKETLGSVYGLDSMQELLLRLGNPEKTLSIVHVAGTNGKGSVISFASSVMRQAGYQVGTYTSPAVFSYEEILQVQGQNIPKEAVARLLSRIRKAAGEMVQDGFSHPTVFEMETAMAFSYFQETGCELVFLECGLGGALDATNVIAYPVCTAFASISLDHMGILGNSLEAIAKAKAGILKPGVPAVSSSQPPAVRAVLEARAEQYGCPLRFVREEETEGFPLGLFGLHQRENAALALAILQVLQASGYSVSQEAIKKGLREARWPGRLEKIGERPDFYLDGAHNADAGVKLYQSVKFYFTNRKICYIMGVFRDKEYEKLLEILSPLSDSIVTVTAPGKRGLTAQELAKSAEKWYADVSCASEYPEAIRLAEEKAGSAGVVVAFGSLSYLGALKAARIGETHE
jgi:dihydrofolate synthase/folylpolyglutamate synthase